MIHFHYSWSWIEFCVGACPVRGAGSHCLSVTITHRHQYRDRGTWSEWQWRRDTNIQMCGCASQESTQTALIATSAISLLHARAGTRAICQNIRRNNITHRQRGARFFDSLACSRWGNRRGTTTYLMMYVMLCWQEHTQSVSAMWSWILSDMVKASPKQSFWYAKYISI